MDDVRRWVVPGRVNVIGEHLDYNGGPSVPMAIDKHLTLKARRRDDHAVHVWSPLGEPQRFDTDVSPGSEVGWAGVVAGSVWALRDEGVDVPGADLVVESELRPGAGLSSSAATAVATVLAVADLAGRRLDPDEAARLARRAETDFVGAPVGVMDQLAVAHGGVHHVDGRTGALTAVPAAWDGLSMVVIDTGVTHAVAAGEYAARHRECRAAAEKLGLEHLADAGPDAVLAFDDSDPAKRRVRHVMTETTRVRGAVRAMNAGDWSQLGTILTSSHESLRDDFEVSCDELDVAVAAALDGGALGARMTGAGFGGCVIALAPTDLLLGLREKVIAGFGQRDWAAPALFTVRPSAGATLVE